MNFEKISRKIVSISNNLIKTVVFFKYYVLKMLFSEKLILFNLNFIIDQIKSGFFKHVIRDFN
jgi:hypothetical protein